MKKKQLSSSIESATKSNEQNTSNTHITFECIRSSHEPNTIALEQMSAAAAFGVKFTEILQQIEHIVFNLEEPISTTTNGSIHCSIMITSLTGAEGVLGSLETVTGKLEGMFELAMFCFACMVEGDRAAVHAANGNQCVPAEIRPAKSSQKSPVIFSEDGHIYVTNAASANIVKGYHSLISAAARVNSLDMSIAMSFGEHKYHFPFLRKGALKITQIVIGRRKVTSPVTGYFRRSRVAELIIGGKVKSLKANERDAGALIKADKLELSVEMVVEVSRPSNPFLGSDESFQIVEVLKVTNSGNQDRLALDF